MTEVKRRRGFFAWILSLLERQIKSLDAECALAMQGGMRADDPAILQAMAARSRAAALLKEETE